ncbi:MAG: hypothetical protein CVV55_04990, partial [Synergistetes bacterium HGW-Synergistetes-2]
MEHLSGLAGRNAQAARQHGKRHGAALARRVAQARRAFGNTAPRLARRNAEAPLSPGAHLVFLPSAAGRSGRLPDGPS